MVVVVAIAVAAGTICGAEAVGFAVAGVAGTDSGAEGVEPQAATKKLSDKALTELRRSFRPVLNDGI